MFLPISKNAEQLVYLRRSQVASAPNSVKIASKLNGNNFDFETKFGRRPASRFKGMLDSQASEQSSRMNAMENASKNAGAMLDALTLKSGRFSARLFVEKSHSKFAGRLRTYTSGKIQVKLLKFEVKIWYNIDLEDSNSRSRPQLLSPSPS